MWTFNDAIFTSKLCTNLQHDLFKESLFNSSNLVFGREPINACWKLGF